MGAVDARIEADTRDPLRDEPSILACRQTTADCATAREQKVAGLLACLLEIVVDRLTCLVCQLELDRAACLPLADRRAVDRIAVRRNVLDSMATTSQPRSLLSIARLNIARSRVRPSIINRVLMDQTC